MQILPTPVHQFNTPLPPHLIHLDIPNFCLSVLSKIKIKNYQANQEVSYVFLLLPCNS